MFIVNLIQLKLIPHKDILVFACLSLQIVSSYYTTHLSSVGPMMPYSDDCLRLMAMLEPVTWTCVCGFFESETLKCLCECVSKSLH